MDKVRFETSDSLGILTLANPPLNLLSEELIDDLRIAVTAAKQTPLRGLLLRAEGKVFARAPMSAPSRGRPEAMRVSALPPICE